MTSLPMAAGLGAGETARPHPEIALPAGVLLKDAQGNDLGVRFVDLNGDGHLDLVFSNAQSYGIHLYNAVERKDLGWPLGWSQVIRSGTAGDAQALPLTTGDAVEFKDDALWASGVRWAGFAELRRPPAPPPRSPQESLRALHVKPGFTAELVAAEPLVQDPIFVDWDARGRMWVVEMADYPFHEDRGQVHHGRVKVLEDSDGDGVYDRATLFLDDLVYPSGLACWKGGVFIASAPEVFFAEATSGEGRADRRTPVLTGFTRGNPQHLVNGFDWGLDGRFYGVNGDSGGKVAEVGGGRIHDLSGRDFSFAPGATGFRLEAGRAQCGRWRDDFGNWFANSNSHIGWHYLLESRYLARNPQLAVATARQELNRAGKRIYPVSAPMRRFNQPHTVNMLTSACNLMPYRDDLFGSDFAQSVFLCEPSNNLVHRQVLVPEGVTFSSRRADDEKTSEFLASEDNWSRFTQARTGPDGCLYVVDMYRLVLEHPEWIPPMLIGNIDLRAGSDRGRIYRIRPTAIRPRAIPRLDAMSVAELGAALASANGWTRDTAQRLLIERGAQWSTAGVTGGVAAQIQQLWTMHTLHTLAPAVLLTAMRHREPRLREHAVRIAEAYLHDGSVLAGVCALVDDADLRVRVQVGFSLGESRDPRIAATLSVLVARDRQTPAMLIAALSSAPDHAEAASWQSQLQASQKAGTAPAPPKIVANSDPDRERVVKSYAGVAALIGNAERGHQLYTTVCSGCHRLRNEGIELGPDLGTVVNKPTEQLIEGILDPSRAVEQRYLLTTITWTDGKQSLGLLAEETPNSITLKFAGSTEVILRSRIARIETGRKSVMPDGLEGLLDPQQLADLLAWMRGK